MMPREMNAPAEHITNDVPPQVAFQWGHNSCLDQVTPIVARLKAENEELTQELEACRDANVQKKKRIAELEDALKRAEGEI